MKLGFYYHIPVKQQGGDLYLPGYLAVFVDALAAEVEVLFLFLHEDLSKNDHADTLLLSPNIRWMNLGGKTPAWHRELFHFKTLGKVRKQLQQCDKLLVRAPTPLAPHFHCYLKRRKIVFMIVGDYLSGAEYLKRPNNLRNRLIYYYLRINDFLFQSEIKKSHIIVNSLQLKEKYQLKAKSVSLIKTTTLRNSDFFEREDTCIAEPVRLLYTGRIDPAKGLFELLNATHTLLQSGRKIDIHIVGWEENPAKPIEHQLIEKSKELQISDRVFFHGKKKVGPELNALYRTSDIYIIPSYHEGFPRAIWEAMANSLPVIATAVGSIPYYIEDKKHALLIPPKDVGAIVDAVQVLIEDVKLRRGLIKNAFELTKNNTIEIQTASLVQVLNTLSYV